MGLAFELSLLVLFGFTLLAASGAVAIRLVDQHHHQPPG
jgi:hypothetical protein